MSETFLTAKKGRIDKSSRSQSRYGKKVADKSRSGKQKRKLLHNPEPEEKIKKNTAVKSIGNQQTPLKTKASSQSANKQRASNKVVSQSSKNKRRRMNDRSLHLAEQVKKVQLKKKWQIEQRKRLQRRQRISRLMISVGGAGLFILTMLMYFFSITKVYGYSMLPTLDDGDVVIINKRAEITRYQLIAFRTDKGEVIVRRVVGLPGEKIELRQGRLYINDEERVEFYLTKDSRQEEQTASDVKEFSPQEVQGMKKIPERAYYVLGDNRSYATDSRYFGPVLESQVVGVIHMRQPEEE